MTVRQLLVILPLALLLYSAGAGAQVIEEIVVTAQKREQPAQDVGISMTVFPAGEIRALQFLTSEDIARQAPGLQAASFSGDPTVMLFAIRGVGQNDFGDHHEGPTATYVDEAYVSALGAVGFQLFDIERVEVLRGPQGTLFGRNATGGLVHVITTKPGEAFDAYADVTLGEFSQRRVEAAVSGPISDNWQARAAVLSNSFDGYVENRVGPDVHETDALAGRLTLRYDGGNDFEALLKVHMGSDNRPDVGGFAHRAAIPGANGLGEFLPSNINADWFGLGSCPGCDALGYRDDDGDPWAGDFDQTGKFERDMSGATLTLTVDRSDWTITSVTDYADLEKTYGEDSDGSPNPLYFYETFQDQQHISQELRINGGGPDVDWTAGVYFLGIRGDYSSLFGSPLFDADQLNVFSLDTDTWAMFGQVEYAFTPSWRVVAGVRWTDDRKEYRFNPLCTGSGCIGFFVFPGSGTVSDIGGFNPQTVGDLTSLDDSDWAGKLQLEWTSDRVLAYAGVSRGHKAGGFNAPIDALLLPAQMIYEKEILTNYEAGFKSSFAGDRVRVNGAAFYYDYDDKQAFTFSGLTATLVNRPAEASGIEVELVARAGADIDVSLGIATLDATVDDVPLPSGAVAEQEAAQAPDLTINAAVRKRWSLGPGTLDAVVDGSYVSEQYFNTINHPTTRSEDYTVWNTRLDYTSADERWSAGLFVNNVTEEDAITYAIDVSGSGYALRSYGPPRWYGVRFRYRVN